MDLVKYYNVSVEVLQEMRWYDNDTLKIKATIILIRPCDKKGQGGCGFVVYKNLVLSVIYFTAIKPRFTLLIIKAK